MLQNVSTFFKRKGKKEQTDKSKNAAKERLHLVLMQDRAHVSADFLDLMKQEIVDVIKKYIDVDENEMDVKLTNKSNDDGTSGAPALFANIPIMAIKEEAKKESIDLAKAKNAETEEAEKEEKAEKTTKATKSTKTTKIAAKKTVSAKKSTTKTEKATTKTAKKTTAKAAKKTKTDKDEAKATKKTAKAAKVAEVEEVSDSKEVEEKASKTKSTAKKTAAKKTTTKKK